MSIYIHISLCCYIQGGKQTTCALPEVFGDGTLDLRMHREEEICAQAIKNDWAEKETQGKWKQTPQHSWVRCLDQIKQFYVQQYLCVNIDICASDFFFSNHLWCSLKIFFFCFKYWSLQTRHRRLQWEESEKEVSKVDQLSQLIWCSYQTCYKVGLHNYYLFYSFFLVPPWCLWINCVAK